MKKIYREGVRVGSRNVKSIKPILFSLIVFCAIGPFSFRQQPDEKSWDSDSSVLTSHFVDEIIQQNYISSEDEDTDAFVCKRGFGLFFISVPRLPTLPIINLDYKTYVNSINSFHYILTFGFSPLRSPPLFS